MALRLRYPRPGNPGVWGTAGKAPRVTAAPVQSAANYYAGLIKSDPQYIQGNMNLRAETDAGGTNSADALRRMLIQYGLVPEGFKDPYGWVNEQTKQLASQNTEAGLSTFARLKRAYDIATKRGSRELASRGMLQSGALTQQRGENDLLYRQQQSDAINGMLDQANQNRMSYAEQMRQAEVARQGLATDAATRAGALAQPAAVPRPLPVVTPPKPRPKPIVGTPGTVGSYGPWSSGV